MEAAGVPGKTGPLCVAITVRNEADRIGACLRALSAQTGPAPDHVVLLINNTDDGTETVVDRLRSTLRFPVTAAIRTLPPDQANAGVARREAMRIAAGIAGPDGILLATDADGEVRPDWIRTTLQALSNGVEVVCGRAEIDPAEALLIPAHLHEDDAREVAFGTLLDRIHALADPDPADPWPRHTEHSGASIAVSVRAWRAAGGVPAVSNGEDRAFLRALRRVDCLIRHAPDVVVSVSGRTIGRASGGMAETMARRILRQDPLLDDSLEAPSIALRRARARATFRALRDERGGPTRIARYAAALALPPTEVAGWLAMPFMGQGWEMLEAASPMLRRVAVERRLLARQHAVAERIVAELLRRRETGRSLSTLTGDTLEPVEAVAGPVVMHTVKAVL